MNNFSKFNIHQKAEPWVSSTVLVGCVLITGVLVLGAMKAEVWGSHLSESATTINSEAF